MRPACTARGVKVAQSYRCTGTTWLARGRSPFQCRGSGIHTLRPHCTGVSVSSSASHHPQHAVTCARRCIVLTDPPCCSLGAVRCRIGCRHVGSPPVVQFVLKRWVSTGEHAGRAKIDPRLNERAKAIGVWSAGVVIGMLGLSYAFVPLYRMFCQATGYAGTANESDKGGGVALQNLRAVSGSRLLTIEFTSDVSPNLSWKFEPMQRLVRVQPGATLVPPPPFLLLFCFAA